MTRSVLIARLAEAGFDPALFDAHDLARIAQALKQLPPVPALPDLTAPALPDPPTALLDEIRSAAQRGLDAMGAADAMLFAFGREKARGELEAVCFAISESLPVWLEESETWLAQCEAGCAGMVQLREKGLAAQHGLVCLYAAARIAQSPAAGDYQAALGALEMQLAALETQLDAAAGRMGNIAALFDTHIPAMLETALALFDEDDRRFSPAAFRQAALRLREVANP